MEQIIMNWSAPNWHSDFGNPEIELLLLKKASLFLLEINNDLSFRLDCYEEGYMMVEIENKSVILGELYVVDVTKNKIGLFKTNGEEKYFCLEI